MTHTLTHTAEAISNLKKNIFSFLKADHSGKCSSVDKSLVYSVILREGGTGGLMVEIRVMAVTPYTWRACRRAQVTAAESLFADLLDMEYRVHTKS